MRATPPPGVNRKGSGEPVVLLHPFAMSNHVYTEVVELLAPSYDVMAVTLPGHWGGPRVPFGKVSVSAFADGVERVMDEAGWQTAHLVGNSIGGWVTFELERRGRARSVVALAPAGGWRRWTWAEFTLGLYFLLQLPGITLGKLLGGQLLGLGWLQRLFLRRVIHHVDRVPAAGRADSLRAPINCSAYIAFMWAALRDGPVSGLADVQAPTLLAFCEKDRLLPAPRYGTIYRENLPAHTEIVELPDVGHIPSLEAPELVASTIAEFVGRHSPGVPGEGDVPGDIA